MVDQQLFRAIVKPNPRADKVLFFLTSYAFPWWIYGTSINRFRRWGYEVVVYDFDDAVLKNDNPQILLGSTKRLVDDMHQRQTEYEARGIKTFHAIGNSLGSYFLFNYAFRYPLNAIVLNGGGSIADIIFQPHKSGWGEIATGYLAKGYNKERINELWKDIDHPDQGRRIHAGKILITYSTQDDTIPPDSTERLISAIKSSGKPVEVRTDQQRHVPSIFLNSLKVKALYKFLNS